MNAFSGELRVSVRNQHSRNTFRDRLGDRCVDRSDGSDLSDRWMSEEGGRKRTGHVRWRLFLPVAAGLVGAGLMLPAFLNGVSEPPLAAAVSAQPPESSPSEPVRPMTIELSPEKFRQAQIQVEPVVRGTLQHEHTVPGRITYNAARHIDVTVPTDGIVTAVLVQPGDRVESGRILAWLNSPEIGTARADVLRARHEADLKTALADRAEKLKAGVQDLTKAIRRSPDFDALKQQFSDRLLGRYRAELFGALSESRLAESLYEHSSGLGEAGALSWKVIQERQASARAARARLEAACEQAEFEVWKDHGHALAAAKDAQRRLQIARQHLASHLLNDAAIRRDGVIPDETALGASDGDLEHLSRVAIRAPFDGTIERRSFSAGERVRAADSLFVLADTSTLWVRADVRENDWEAMAVVPGQELAVQVPALGEERLTARVQFVGREVSTDTNAVPIVAQIDHADDRLRPGLFVRVAVPVETRRNVLTVHSGAVMHHEGAAFVFVADSERCFRRVDVQVGQHDARRVEIRDGLQEGDHVVVQGAFLLKSELLLEGEEE